MVITDLYRSPLTVKVLKVSFRKKYEPMTLNLGECNVFFFINNLWTFFAPESIVLIIEGITRIKVSLIGEDDFLKNIIAPRQYLQIHDVDVYGSFSS